MADDDGTTHYYGDGCNHYHGRADHPLAPRDDDIYVPVVYDDVELPDVPADDFDYEHDATPTAAPRPDIDYAADDDDGTPSLHVGHPNDRHYVYVIDNTVYDVHITTIYDSATDAANAASDDLG